MAIERNNYGASAQTADPEENLNRLKHILEALTDLQDVQGCDDKRIQDECNRIVRELVVINVPSSATNIKEFSSHLNSIGQLLERVIRQSSNPEQIFISCLQTLYCLLVTHGKCAFVCLFHIKSDRNLAMDFFLFHSIRNMQKHHRREVASFLTFTIKIQYQKQSNY